MACRRVTTVQTIVRELTPGRSNRNLLGVILLIRVALNPFFQLSFGHGCASNQTISCGS